MTVEAGRSGGRAIRPPAGQRRRELAETAATHFHQLGFHRVSLADVAAGVGVTAPAVYRHFRNKNALLAGAIATGLDHVEAALDGAVALDDALDRLAGAALERRDFWVLFQREIRHLDDRDRSEASARFRDLFLAFTDHVRAARPDVDAGQAHVLATGAFAALASPSTQPLELSHELYRGGLARAAKAACATTFPTARPRPVRGRKAPPPSARGEQVLGTAIALFHRHGYAAVSVDDIGAAVGMAGPSIYHHFPTKAELLLAAFGRAAALLPEPTPSADDPLGDLVERYARLAVQQRELFGVYVTETVNLPEHAARDISETHRDDVGRWVGVLRSARPGLAPVAAELLVHAARNAVHDLTRVGRLHSRPHIVGEIVALVRAVLDSDVAATGSGPGQAVRGVGPEASTAHPDDPFPSDSNLM